MKLLFKSIYLFLLGVYAECYKKRFDYIMDKTIKKGGNIASPSLTHMSNRCYALYTRFKEREKELCYEMRRHKMQR
ncbi:MAG: hypothetical protein ACI4A5_00945 [Hominilimicola sp.]